MDQVRSSFDNVKANSNSRLDSFEARMATLEAYLLMAFKDGGRRLEKQYETLFNFIQKNGTTNTTLIPLEDMRNEVERIKSDHIKAEIQMKHLRSNDASIESPSLLQQVKNARTDKITAEYRLQERELEIESLKEALKIANGTIDSMKSSNANKDSERVVRLRKQLKEYIDRTNEAETKIIENDELKTQVLGLKAHVQDLKEQVRKAEGQYPPPSRPSMQNSIDDHSEHKNTDAPLKLEDMMMQKDSALYLRNRTKEMEVKLDRSTAEAQRGKALLVEKMQQITTLKTSHEMVQSELLKREKELKQNEKKYKDYTLHLRETITNNEVQLKSMKGIQRQKDEEIAQLELLNMSLKSERDLLVAQINTLKSKQESFETDTAQKQQEYSDTILHFKEQILKKEESINKSAAIMASMEENITLMSKTLDDSRLQKKGLEKSMETVTQEAKEKVEVLQRQLDMKTLDLKDVTKKYNRAQDIISHRDETISSLEWKIEMTQADLDATKEKVGLSESRFTLNERSLKKQIAVMKAEIDDHEHVQSATQLQMEAKDSTIGLLTEDGTKLRANVNHLESIIQALKVEKDDQVTKLNGEIGKLEWTIKQLKESELKWKHSLSEETVQVSNLTTKVHKLEHQLKAVMDEKDMAYKAHLEEQGDLKGQIKVLERNIVESKSTIEDAHALIINKEKSLASFKSDLDSKEVDLKRVEERYTQKLKDAEDSNKDMGEKLIKLQNALELQKAAMHKDNLAIDTLREKNASLETKLSLSRAEIETVNRRVTLQMNESAEALDKMRLKNKKLTESNQDLTSKVKELEALVEQQKEEIKGKVEEIENRKQDYFDYRSKQSDKHKEHVQLVTEKKVKLHELQSVVESKEAMIEKLREKIKSLNSTIALSQIEKEELSRKHDGDLKEQVEKKQEIYFKLLNQFKNLQQELMDCKKKVVASEEEVARVKTHPATKATELYRESILLLNEAMSSAAQEAEGKDADSQMSVIVSDLVEKFRNVAKYSEIGTNDLKITLGNAYVGLAKIGGLRKAWTLAIRNGERALMIWREIENKEDEFDMLQLMAGVYAHAYVDNQNKKLLDRSEDKLRFCLSAAKFGKPEWKKMVDDFEQMIDNVNEVKVGGKVVKYNDNSRGNFHELIFELVM